MDLKEFYEDSENPAIPAIKAACSWVLVNGKDLSFIEGLPRYTSNVFLSFGTSALMYYFLLESQNPLEFYISFSLMSAITSILFMRMVAYWLLKWMDKTQGQMRKFDRSRNSETFK